MHSESILVVLGIEGQLYTAKAFSQKFELPVSGVVLTQEMERIVEESEVYQPDRLYSLPRFYRRHIDRVTSMSDHDIRANIREYEGNWGIASIGTLVYFDRYFRSERNYSTVLRHALIYMEFVETILSEENPVWCRSNTTTFFGLVLQAACLSKRIPALKPRAACIHARIEFMDESVNGALRGWRQMYRALTAAENAVAPETRQQAIDWLGDFRDRPVRPGYAEMNSVVEFRLKTFLNGLWQGIRVRFDNRYWHAILNHPIDRKLRFREPPGKVFFHDFVWREMRAIWLRSAKWYRHEVSLDEPYIYFPLQFSPEISTLTHGLRVEDQAALVETFAKFLPSKYRLYVKEHTSMIGRRPASLYRRLKRLHNVTLVSPRVSTFSLIRNASAVATITSTAGWEAFLFGKPVIVFGNVFFKEFPNVLNLVIDDDCAIQVAEYLENFSPVEDEIVRSVIAYFSVTYAATTGDIGIEISRDEAQENATVVARAFLDQLERFPLDALTNAPAPLKSGRIHA